MAYQLAQLNIARLLHPLEHPQLAEFVAGLDRINQLAEGSQGFVWRLKTDSGNATDVQHPWSADPFVYVGLGNSRRSQELHRTDHLDFYMKRAHWFEKPSQPHYVLWWIPAGHIPTLQEAQERLEHYRQNGATPHAFWFGKLFPSPAATPVSR